MDPSGIFFTSHAGDRSLVRTRAQWVCLLALLLVLATEEPLRLALQAAAHAVDLAAALELAEDRTLQCAIDLAERHRALALGLGQVVRQLEQPARGAGCEQPAVDALGKARTELFGQRLRGGFHQHRGLPEARAVLSNRAVQQQAV